MTAQRAVKWPGLLGIVAGKEDMRPNSSSRPLQAALLPGQHTEHRIETQKLTSYSYTTKAEH